MDHDLLIAYGWENLVKILSIVLVGTFAGVVLLLRQNFAGSFLIESTLLFTLLGAGGLLLLLLATDFLP